MANKTIDCPQCGKEITTKPKKGFFTGTVYSCNKCDYQGGLPLKTSTKIIYWSITIVVAYIIVMMSLGGKGSIGWLGIIAPIYLFTDWRTNRKLRQYWEEKKLPPVPLPKEDHAVLKGLVVSGLLVLLTFWLGSVLYGNEANINTSAPTVDNWQPFHSTEGKFTINFPKYPTSSSSTNTAQGINMNSTQYDSVSASGDEYLAQFVVYSLRPEQLNVKGALEGAVNGSVNSDSKNKLVSSSFTQYKSYPAIDFLIYNSGQQVYLKGRNVLIGSTLYTAFVMSKSQNPVDYDTFINSLELTN